MARTAEKTNLTDARIAALSIPGRGWSVPAREDAVNRLRGCRNAGMNTGNTPAPIR